VICTTCGQDNAAHLVFCQACGQRLGPRVAPPTPPVGIVPPIMPGRSPQQSEFASTVAQPPSGNYRAATVPA
jgi:hypothetical protein